MRVFLIELSIILHIYGSNEIVGTNLIIQKGILSLYQYVINVIQLGMVTSVIPVVGKMRQKIKSSSSMWTIS